MIVKMQRSCVESCSNNECKGNVYQQFFDKNQSRMHQIFTQMYLTVSIGPSHMESPTELFIKKFFFQWSPHFSAFEPLNKNYPRQVDAILMAHHPLLIPQRKSKKHQTQSLITNFLSFNHPQYKSNHHKPDLLITKSKISHCLLQLQTIKS